MQYFNEKYISLFTDFGFKKVFGEEVNKDLLIDFLNELLSEKEGKIISIQYLNNENLGKTEIDRRAIFDIHCENEKGEKFIVEMQKTKQGYFKDRTLYYSTFPIQKQAEKTDWNYELKAVYCIAILDFIFEEDKSDMSKFRYDIKLSDIHTNKVFYDKLTFIYIEMPKFNKSLEEINSKYEKWLYLIKNLNRLDSLPHKLQEKIFLKLFEVAEISKFTPDQANLYENSLKIYRDLQNSLDTALEEGIQKGREEGIQDGILLEKINIAKIMLKSNEPIEKIKSFTGLSDDTLNSI